MPAMLALKPHGEPVTRKEFARRSGYCLRVPQNQKELTVHHDAKHDATVLTTTTFAVLVNVLLVTHPLTIHPAM